MAFEKAILKVGTTGQMVFEYQPKDINMNLSQAAIDYVHDEDRRKSDFKMSELAADQSGVAKLEGVRSQNLIDEKVLEKLKEVQERAYKEAYDLGQIEGTKKAFEAQQAAMTEKLKTLDDVLAALEQIKLTLIKENEARFVELSFQIAKKIALRDLSEHRETIVTLLQQVVGQLQEEQLLSLKVSPDDYATLEEMQKRTDFSIEALKKVKLTIDPQVENGGCLIEVVHGEVDLQVRDRVERVWEAIDKQITINKKS
jgi:flagellar assembly protein FliH